MSYCRFTDDSDVYAYWCDGGVQFWVAGRDNKGLDRLCNTFNEAYQYAKSLRDEHGLDVPDSAIDALKADALDEAKRMSGPKSAVAELLGENERLRELVRDVLHFAAYSPRPRTTDESVRAAHELFELGVRAHELGVDE